MAHREQVRLRGCLVCGEYPEMHHVKELNGKRDHRFVVPLCVWHHKSHEGVHGLSRNRIRETDPFKDRYGLDLEAIAKNYWNNRVL